MAATPMKLMPNALEGMDPSLFALDWARVFEVLAAIVVLSFLLERALALLFESRWFLVREKRREDRGQGSYKPLIAFLLAAAGCWLWKFDALSVILVQEQMTILGALITGAVVAGGSKASIKLFHDVFDAKSSMYRKLKAGG